MSTTKFTKIIPSLFLCFVAVVVVVVFVVVDLRDADSLVFWVEMIMCTTYTVDRN